MSLSALCLHNVGLVTVIRHDLNDDLQDRRAHLSSASAESQALVSGKGLAPFTVLFLVAKF